MKIILALGLVALSLNSYALPLPSNDLCKNPYVRNISRVLQNVEIDVGLNPVDLEFLDGGALVAGYHGESEPAFFDGLYSRTDTWKVKTEGIPDFHLNADTLVKAGVRHEIEASFIRHFKDSCEAKTTVPMWPNRAPLTSKRALAPDFKVGHYFVFKAGLGFVVSAETLKMLGVPGLGVSLKGEYLLEGYYQIHVMRIDDKHIRLKVLARRGKEKDVSLSVGVQGEFNVWGVKVDRSGFKRLLNPDPIKVFYNKTHASVFMVDYLLDMTEPKVAKAFDEMVNKAINYKAIQLAIPFKDVKELERSLVMNIAPLENIYASDFQAGNLGRIQRNIRSSATLDSNIWGVELGNRIAGIGYESGSSVSRINLREANDDLSRYLLTTNETQVDALWLFSWGRVITQRRMQSLFETTEDDKTLKPLEMVLTVEKKDKRLSLKEFAKVRKILLKTISDQVYVNIPFQDWKQDTGKALNFGMRLNVTLFPEAILNAPVLSAKELMVSYPRYLSDKGLKPRDFYSDTPAMGRGGQAVSADEKFKKGIKEIAEKLSYSFNNTRADSERIEKFLELQKNPIFSQTGFGFLMSIAPLKTKEWFIVNLDMSADGKKLQFVYGSVERSALFRKILSIKAALEDEDLDLRREAESISVGTLGPIALN
ncbi:MAG: hypothetical protein V4598_04405 [Bdellovibrionota bacterium]